MTTDTKEVELAKQLFLDALNGNMNLGISYAETMAKRSLEYAEAFYRQIPQADSADIVTFPVATKGCPACFGSVAKLKAKCAKCKGTGRVPV